MLKSSYTYCLVQEVYEPQVTEAGWVDGGTIILLAMFYTVSLVSTFSFSQTRVAILTFLVHGVKLTFSSPSLELVPDLCKQFLQ